MLRFKGPKPKGFRVFVFLLSVVPQPLSAQPVSPQPFVSEEKPAPVKPVRSPQVSDDNSLARTLLNMMDSRINSLEKEVKDMEATTDRFTTVASVVGGVLAMAGIIGALIHWKIQKDQLKKFLEDQAPKELRKVLKDQEARLGKQAEAELVKLTAVLVLKSSHRYDDALEVLGYEKETIIFQDLSEKPPVMQRLIIECLARARERHSERLETAWLALNQLIRQDNSIETLRLYLEVGRNTKNYDDALKAYLSSGVEDLKCEQHVASILRRQNRQEEAIARLNSYRTHDDFMTMNTLASLHRDLGESEKSHDLLKAKVMSFIDTFDGVYLSGWDYAFNSYIASCVDLSQPEEAMPAVHFLLRNNESRASSLNSVILAVSRMPADSDRRGEILRQLREIIDGLPSGVTKALCGSSLSAMDGDFGAAIEEIKNFLSRLSSHSLEGGTREIFLRTKMHLGELYLLKGEAHTALAILKEVHTLDDFGGECTFMVARAEAATGSPQTAVEWLRKAGDRKRHWFARARFDPSLKNVPLVSTLLAETASIRAMR